MYFLKLFISFLFFFFSSYTCVLRDGPSKRAYGNNGELNFRSSKLLKPLGAGLDDIIGKPFL